MDYVGPPVIFSIKAAEGARGCPAPNSIIQVGNVCYYLGEDGFYRFDGAQSTAIGKQRVDDFFFADVDADSFHLVSAAVDTQKAIVYWAYPRAGVPYCNRILAYNWDVDRWSITDIDSVQAQLLLHSLTLGVVTDTVGGNNDDYSQVVDDRQFAGGRHVLAGFTTANKLGYFNGAHLAATIDTAEANLVDGWVSKFTGARVLTDATAPTLAVGGRMRTDASPVFGATHGRDAFGFHPAHAAARYHRGRISVPAGATWEHVRGLDIPAECVVRVSQK
jgi:hypothetical protein